MTRVRRALLAFAWLATAAGSGLLAAWLLRPEPEVVVRTIEREGEPAAPTGREGPAAPGVARIGSAAPATPTDEDGPPPPAGDPAAPASLAITVSDSSGTRVRDGGTVYAMDAGAEGSNDGDDLCNAEVSPEGTATLRLPGPGTYDVGFSGTWGSALARDVSVPAGEGTPLDLRLPGDRAILVRCDPPWPPPAEGLQVKVGLRSEDEPGEVSYPGRTQRSHVFAEIPLGPEGTGTSRLLPSDRSFIVSASLVEVLPFLGPRDAAGNVQGPRLQISPRYSLFPDPATARPGETVRLRLQVGAALVLEFRPAWSAPMPAGKATDLGFTVLLRQGDAVQWRAFSAKALHGTPPLRFHLPAKPGPCRLEWSGTGVLAGALDDVALKSGEIAEHVIPVHQDASGRAVPLPSAPPPPPGAAAEVPPPESAISVTVENIPEGASAVVIGLRRDSEGEEDWLSGDVRKESPALEWQDAWTRYPTVLALLPPSLASDPVPTTAPGALRVALRPAGLLLVATPEVFPPSLGRLRLRLPGRRPVPTAHPNGREIEEVRTEAVVETGDLVGPLPEGTYVFEVRLGGVRLPDATATVRAGKIEILRIRR